MVREIYKNYQLWLHPSLSNEPNFCLANSQECPPFFCSLSRQYVRVEESFPPLLIDKEVISHLWLMLSTSGSRSRSEHCWTSFEMCVWSRLQIASWVCCCCLPLGLPGAVQLPRSELSTQPLFAPMLWCLQTPDCDNRRSLVWGLLRCLQCKVTSSHQNSTRCQDPASPISSPSSLTHHTLRSLGAQQLWTINLVSHSTITAHSICMLENDHATQHSSPRSMRRSSSELWCLYLPLDHEISCPLGEMSRDFSS